jgi:hypothetical protein
VQLGFHQVAVVNKLVHKQRRNNYILEEKQYTKTIQKHNRQNKKQNKKTRKQTWDE